MIQSAHHSAIAVDVLSRPMISSRPAPSNELKYIAALDSIARIDPAVRIGQGLSSVR